MHKAIVAFRFLGGNILGECKKSDNPPHAFEEAADKLVGYYPGIFPNHLPAPPGGDICHVDVHVGKGGDLRVHCTYFAMQVPRTFWNVFCFCYSTAEWTQAERNACMGIPSHIWYELAKAPLTEKLLLDIPDITTGANEPPVWNGEEIFVENFPCANGKDVIDIQGSILDWKDALGLKQTQKTPFPGESPAPANTQSEPNKLKNMIIGIKNRIEEMKTKPRTFIALAICLLAVYVSMQTAVAATDTNQLQAQKAQLSSAQKGLERERDELNRRVTDLGKQKAKLQDEKEQLLTQTGQNDEISMTLIAILLGLVVAGGITCVYRNSKHD